MSMQIIKQLFDIGELFGVVEDLELVFRSYEVIARAEIGYRGNKITHREAIEDTFQSAVKVCGFGVKGFKRDEHSDFLIEGIKKIDSHMVKNKFKINDVQVTASRVALLAALVRSGKVNKDLRGLRWKSEAVAQLESLSLTGSLERFNRVKFASPEAFYNLYTVQEFFM